MASNNFKFDSHLKLGQCSHEITNKVCVHLTLGKCLCTSTTTDETQQVIDSSTKKRKLVKQATNDEENKKKKKKKMKSTKTRNDEERKWGYSLDLMLYDDPWKIKKVLENSDLGSNSRLMLNKMSAEDFVLPILNCNTDDEIKVTILDIDTNSFHTLKFKKLASSKSYIFKSGWIKKFVLRRDLKKGDEIGFHWDQYNNRFNFTVFKVYGNRP